MHILGAGIDGLREGGLTEVKSMRERAAKLEFVQQGVLMEREDDGEDEDDSGSANWRSNLHQQQGGMKERGEMRKKLLGWENTKELSISIYWLNFLSNDAYVPFKWQFDSTKWLTLGPWIGSSQEQKFLEINQRTQNHNFSRLREKTQILWNWRLSLLKSEVVKRGVSGHRMAMGQIQKFLGIIWAIYWT